MFDLSPLQPLTGGDPLLVRNLLGELMATNGKDLALLGMLLERGDSAGLSELAHRLIGAARVVRAEEVVAACQRLMAACAVPSALTACAGVSKTWCARWSVCNWS